MRRKGNCFSSCVRSFCKRKCKEKKNQQHDRMSIFFRVEFVHYTCAFIAIFDNLLWERAWNVRQYIKLLQLKNLKYRPTWIKLKSMRSLYIVSMRTFLVCVCLLYVAHMKFINNKIKINIQYNTFVCNVAFHLEASHRRLITKSSQLHRNLRSNS